MQPAHMPTEFDDYRARRLLCSARNIREPQKVVLDLKDRVASVAVVHSSHLRGRILELKLTGSKPVA